MIAPLQLLALCGSACATAVATSLLNCNLLDPVLTGLNTSSSKSKLTNSMLCALDIALEGGTTTEAVFAGIVASTNGFSGLLVPVATGASVPITDAPLTIPITSASPALENFTGLLPPVKATPGQKVVGKIKHTLAANAIITVGPTANQTLLTLDAPVVVEAYFDGEVKTVDSNGEVTAVVGSLKDIVWPPDVAVTNASSTKYILKNTVMPASLSPDPATGLTVSGITRGIPLPDPDFELFQIRGCHGTNMLYLQMKPPADPADGFSPGDSVVLTIKVNPACPVCAPYVPIVYGVLSAIPGTEPVLPATTTELKYAIPFTGYYNTILAITELGYIMNAKYEFLTPALTGTFVSDLFATNPLIEEISPYLGAEDFKESPSLPPNAQYALNKVRHRLRRASSPICASGDQLGRMSFAAFNSEIGNYFRCDTSCCGTICCNSIFEEYTTFVSSCIKVISHCGCQGSAPINLCPCGPQSNNACWAINEEICRFATTIDISVSGGGGGCGFGDVSNYGQYSPVCSCAAPILAVEVGVDVVIAAQEIGESETEEAAARRGAPRRRRATEVKTTTSVSTYGWYVAGGVVAVSVAVAVYVFVL